jgi:hypothetical protein
MRSAFLFLAVIVVSGSPHSAFAQDVAGGYSYARVTNGDGLNFPGGWFGTVGLNVMPMWGVVADFSGAYKSESATAGAITAESTLKMHSYLFGPRVRWSDAMMPVTVYGQMLFGGQTTSGGVTVTGTSVSASSGASQTNFALAPGGGVDVKIDKQWSARGGVNFRMVKPSGDGDWAKIVQVVAGVVYTVR